MARILFHAVPQISDLELVLCLCLCGFSSLITAALFVTIQFCAVCCIKNVGKSPCKCNEKTKKKHSHTVNKDCIPKQKTPQTALLKSPPKGNEARGSVLDDELQLTLQQEEAGLLHAQKAKVSSYNS